MSSNSKIPYVRPNTIYCGDCKDVLRRFPDGSVDLIYADPPFFSNQQYEIIWKDGHEIRAFEDRWKGGIEHYILWMRDRVEQCYRALKATGSFYLHCDYHANHYLKVMLDQLFGYHCFRGQIVWKRTSAHSNVKSYGSVHDVILFYTKSDKWTWNKQYQKYDQSYIESHYRRKDPDGRIYRTDNLIAPSEGYRYEWHGVSRNWRLPKERMKELDKQGRIVYTQKGTAEYKRYLDEMPGVPLQDVWSDIPPINSQARERLGYPTQKPELLLERIIKASSNPTDIVLDPFCGCGTAIAVAHKLGRRWIGIDVSPTACNLMQTRMKRLGASAPLVGMPLTEKDLRNLPPFEFQNWVIQRLFGRVSSRKSGDMGIDGYTFEGYPVQVKQSADIGRNVIDNFETALRRSNKTNGFIVAFSFGKGAYEEVARAKLHDNLEIKLITISELLKNNKKQVTLEHT